MVTSSLPQGTTQSTISLRIGHPDPTTLLTPELQAVIQGMWSVPQSPIALQYGPEQGSPALISYLVKKLNREQKLSLHPEQVMIVAGSTSAVDMIARLYAGPGSVILLEAPTYADAIHIFRDHRIEMCAIPVDSDGLNVEALERALSDLKAVGKSPAFLYTIPTFQNPSGTTLPVERRQQVLSLARQYGFFIVEDDVYRDLYFESKPPDSFFALSAGENVMTIGSFSKILAPGFRLGWLLGAPDSIQRCVNCGTTQMGGGANPFAAQVVTEYCCKDYLDSHIAALRSVYKHRRDTMVSALERFMPDSVRWTIPLGGFFLWINLPDDISAAVVKRRALEHNVTVAAGSGFYVEPSEGDHSLRLAFSYAPLNDIEAGIKILGEIVREYSA